MEHPLCPADVPQGPGSFKGCRLCDDHQVAPEPAPARGRDSAGSAGVSLWPLASPGEICFQWKLSNIYKSKRNSLMKRLMQFLLSLHLCPPPVYFEKQILDITLFHLSWYKIRTLKKKPQSQRYPYEREQTNTGPGPGLCSTEVGLGTSRLRGTVSQGAARSRAEPLYSQLLHSFWLTWWKVTTQPPVSIRRATRPWPIESHRTKGYRAQPTTVRVRGESRVGQAPVTSPFSPCGSVSPPPTGAPLYCLQMRDRRLREGGRCFLWLL